MSCERYFGELRHFYSSRQMSAREHHLAQRNKMANQLFALKQQCAVPVVAAACRSAEAALTEWQTSHRRGLRLAAELFSRRCLKLSPLEARTIIGGSELVDINPLIACSATIPDDDDAVACNSEVEAEIGEAAAEETMQKSSPKSLSDEEVALQHTESMEIQEKLATRV